MIDIAISTGLGRFRILRVPAGEKADKRQSAVRANIKITKGNLFMRQDYHLSSKATISSISQSFFLTNYLLTKEAKREHYLDSLSNARSSKINTDSSQSL